MYPIASDDVVAPDRPIIRHAERFHDDSLCSGDVRMITFDTDSAMRDAFDDITLETRQRIRDLLCDVTSL